MFLVIRNVNGVDFKNKEKVVSLRGNGFLNDISKDDYNLLKSHNAFNDMLEKGFIVVNDNKLNSDNQKSDIMEDVKNKQVADQKKEQDKRKSKNGLDLEITEKVL